MLQSKIKLDLCQLAGARMAAAEISKAAAEIKQRARLEGPLQFAPIRSLDEFILTKARFQAPEYNNVDKFRNRVVSKAHNPHLHRLL